MKIDQLKWGSLLSYGQMAINILIGLIYMPFMIRYLGQSEYGLYQTALSVISMLSILNLGFNAGYVRYFSKYRANNDKDSIEKLNGLYLIVFSVIGLFSLIIGIFLLSNIELVFKSGLTDGEYEIGKKLLFVSLLNLSVSFPMSVFTTIISANERFVVLKLLGMINTVLSPLVALPLLLMGFRSVALVTISLVLALVTDAIYIYYVFFVLKNKFVFKDFEKGLLKNLFSFTFFIALLMVIDQVNWNIDRLILARYRGTAAVAIYSVGFNLYYYYANFSVSVSGVFTPRVHQIVNSTRNNPLEQRKQLSNLFIKIGRIQFLLLGLVASGVVFFGKSFIVNIWVGKEYEQSYIIAVFLVISATIALIQNVGIEIQRALNKHRFSAIIYALMAVLNLIVSIILCQRYGAVGCVIGTALSYILANGVIMNIYYQKECNLNILEFWKEILRMSAGLIVPAIVGVMINKFIDTSNIITFSLAVIAYSAVYCASMWLCSMNSFEKGLITKPINMVLIKLKIKRAE